MEPNLRKTYPTWSDLLALLGVYILSSVAFNLAGGLLIQSEILPYGLVILLTYLLTFLVTIGYALAIKRMRMGPGAPLLRFGFRKADPALVLWGFVTVFATTLVVEPLLGLFPDRWLEWLGEQMKIGGWMMLTTVVAAPVLEEILFRGILQESLMRKYGPWPGILVASAIFGIVHGIPQQVLNAFFVGGMIGLVYYRSQSFVPCILIHALNNAVSYFTWTLGGEKIVFTREMIGDDRTYWLLYAAACAVFLFAVLSTARAIRRDNRNKASVGPAAENGKDFEKSNNISPQ